MAWYTIQNKYGVKAIVREISEPLALSKASKVFQREAKLKGVKGYKRADSYWNDLKVVEKK